MGLDGVEDFQSLVEVTSGAAPRVDESGPVCALNGDFCVGDEAVEGLLHSLKVVWGDSAIGV